MMTILTEFRVESRIDDEDYLPRTFSAPKSVVTILENGTAVRASRSLAKFSYFDLR